MTPTINECVNNKGRTIGEIMGEEEEGSEWTCQTYKENAERGWDGDYTEDFKRAVKIGCNYSLCNKLKNDPYISNFGLNQKQQKDIYDLNNIITQNHGKYENYYEGSK